MFYNTPPWAITANTYASSKAPPKKPSGKKTVIEEKSTYQPYFVLHMLPHQKPNVRNLQVKTHKGKKEYNIKPS
jgi:hypothetical protein